MNPKSVLYSMIGLMAVGATTATVLSLTVKPFSQVSQAQPAPSPTVAPAPGMRGMMGQPDQHFIIMMIPHHEGAIAMADLALERSQRPEIQALAQSIKDTQAQEIVQMQDWYQRWYGAEVPEAAPGAGMGMHGRNGTGMGMRRGWNGNGTRPDYGTPGMGCWGMGMRQGNTTALENAPDFDRAFIDEMIPHHQMGVMMAQMALANSDRPEIRELAQRIIDTQSAEINQMQEWYQEWYQ